MTDIKLFELKEKIAFQNVIAHQLEQLEQAMAVKKSILMKCEKRLHKENLDLEKMGKFSLTSMYNYLQGKYDQALDKEYREVIDAKMSYDAALYEYDLIIEQMELLKARSEDVVVLQIAYDKLLQEKEAEILDTDHQLVEILDAMGIVQIEIREIDEAILVGENLLKDLQKIVRALKSAVKWGDLDILGAHFITDVDKHMKICRAQKYMSRAKLTLEQFNREMADIKHDELMDFDITSSMNSTDFFLNNIFIDVVVQDKIESALDGIGETRVKLERVLDGLEITKNEAVLTLQKMERSREEFLEKKI